MRYYLDCEDALTTQARMALQNAREVALARADDSSKQVIASASRAYDLSRMLRLRTHIVLSDLGAFSEQLAEAQDETFAKVQQTIASGVDEIRVALEQIRAEADALLTHP